MGRWNNGSSIHIKTIPKEQIAEAIEEWAEGSEPLKNLLWTCYERGILTDECHWGGGSYISFEGTDSIEEIKRMVRNVGDINQFQMLCRAEAMNPLSLMRCGNEPSFSMGVLQPNRESGNLLFSKLREGLDLDLPSNIAFEKVLDFYKAFEGKETGIHFRLRHSEEEGYSFSIESHEKEHNISYYDELFSKAGLEKDDIDPDYPVISWSIKSDNKKEFDQMMTKAYDVITKEWSLEEPTEISDDMSFMMKLRIMYKKLAGTPEGRQELYKWGIDNAPDYILREAGIKRPDNDENER